MKEKERMRAITLLIEWENMILCQLRRLKITELRFLICFLCTLRVTIVSLICIKGSPNRWKSQMTYLLFQKYDICDLMVYI